VEGLTNKAFGFSRIKNQFSFSALAKAKRMIDIFSEIRLKPDISQHFRPLASASGNLSEPNFNRTIANFF